MGRRVNLVIVLIDNYSNRIIPRKNIQVTFNKLPPYIVKKDGYYIFMKAEESGILEVSSEEYQEVKQFITITKYKNKIVYIRLNPGKKYKCKKTKTISGMLMSKNANTISGMFKSNKQVIIRFVNPKETGKIISLNKDNKRISIYQKEDICLEGMHFVVEQNNVKDRFSIWEKSSSTSSENKRAEYILDGNISNDYDLEICTFKREYQVSCNASGEFYFLIPRDTCDCREAELETPGNVRIVKIDKNDTRYNEE